MEERPISHSAFRLSDYHPEASLLELLPLDFVKQKKIVPLKLAGGRLLVGVPLQNNQVKSEGVSLLVGMPVDFLPASIEEIEKFIAQYYVPATPSTKSTLNLVVGGPVPSLQDQQNLDSVVSTPGMELNLVFQKILLDATLNRATEILLSLNSAGIQFRERIRNNLVNASLHLQLSSEDGEKLFSWLKTVGACQMRDDVQWVTWMREIKVKNELYYAHCLLTQSVATQHLSIRLAQRKEKVFSPSSWGMDPAQSRVFSELIAKSQGLLLFCGSEQHNIDDVFIASGNMMATPNRHVIAVEDDPETWASGIDSFIANGNPSRFRELLRLGFQHNPDVLLVNPLAGRDDVDFCLREAIKGRFIMARIYAGDAAESLFQMLIQGIEPYLLGAGITGIVAKKTLRLNCSHCQVADTNVRTLAKDLGIPLGMQPAAFYRGRGCHHCEHTGCDGETDIYEVFPMDDDLRLVLKDNNKIDAIRMVMKSKGLPTFRQTAIHKAVNGQISLAEIVRVTSK